MKIFEFGVSINDEKIESISSKEKRLYVVSGSSRGGTSALAYALRRASVHFGNVDANNHELPELMSPDLTEEKIRSAIDKLLNEQNIAGAKLPNFSFHLKWLTNQYPDSVYLYILRNPLDVSTTIMTRSPSHSLNTSDLRIGILHSFRFYSAMANVVGEIEQPIYLISFEKMKAQPDQFVSWLEEIGVSFSDDVRPQLAKELATPGYKKLPADGVG
ncbi:hypothetical protein V1T76_10880 [Roseibium sp. FZY0029]|uniref:hypothetical protein n=1 Tax=Roseibium sp. FZY0029 TaxID=3116647 RepID=UPI002EAB0C3B|nr:hypothetical protein [Roseibium sp. FZY0029]